jgi:hypothetical protein
VERDVLSLFACVFYRGFNWVVSRMVKCCYSVALGSSCVFND